MKLQIVQYNQRV